MVAVNASTSKAVTVPGYEPGPWCTKIPNRMMRMICHISNTDSKSANYSFPVAAIIIVNIYLINKIKNNK